MTTRRSGLHPAELMGRPRRPAPARGAIVEESQPERLGAQSAKHFYCCQGPAGAKRNLKRIVGLPAPARGAISKDFQPERSRRKSAIAIFYRRGEYQGGERE